jgi:beta-phosphoglucomutase-like phosphatase (HAD superfamily)
VGIKGVIFDSDGTLVDSENVAAALLHAMLIERGIELPEDEVLRRFRGVQGASHAGRRALHGRVSSAQPG